MNFNYDKFNRLSFSKWFVNNIALSTSYIYGDNSVNGQTTGLIYGINLNGTQQLAYQYDELARLKTRTLNTTTPFVTEYGYLEGATAHTTTTLVKTVKNGNDTLEYTYDELGNITSVAKNGTIIETYTYDSLGQLTSATYGGNTFTYAYDNGGNITEIKKNDIVIKSYTYGNSEWKDLLTTFNGENITYDEIGNPLTYRNGMNFTWQNGRQLATITQNGNTLATYTYNADGLRTTKTVNGTTTEYYWQNGTLYGQKTGDEYIFFLYDEIGSAYGFIIQTGTEKSHYYYEFNLQGDIIGIVDSTGTNIVEYTYGAWGDILSITGTLADTIGQKNPLRYRGYYYDTETGFYYVSSRYYDVEIGRFLNADGYISTGQGVLGNNMFAYCGNNPINRKDPSGQGWITALIVTVVVTAILSGCSSNNKSTVTKEPYSNQANCYAYALKLENDPRTDLPFTSKPQPGEFSGNALTSRDLKGNSATVKKAINKKVSADAKVLNLSYTEVSSASHVPKPGNWVVALAYATDGTDYHWWRKNDDGTWSHKPGSTPIIHWDASGNTITDPGNCDRGIYDGFLGYYEVGPN